MKSKHQSILNQIFQHPIPSSISWREVESLLSALNAEISEGRGSRVRIALNGVRAVFHRPHPRKEVDKGAIVSMKRFLKEAGIKDDI